MADVGEEPAALRVGLVQRGQGIGQLAGAGVDLHLEPLALRRFALAVLLELGRQRIDAAGHFGELVLAGQRDAVAEPARLQRPGAFAELLQRTMQRTAEVQGRRHRADRDNRRSAQPQPAHPGQRGVGGRPLALHGGGLAGDVLGDQPSHVMALGHVEHPGQCLPGLRRIGAGLQRTHPVDGLRQGSHAALQNHQRLAPAQMLLSGLGAAVELDGLLRQHLQPLQRSLHGREQLGPRAAVGMCPLLHLRDPGAQALLLRRELDEAGGDVAGHPPAQHLAFGDRQRGGGQQRSQRHHQREQGQDQGDATTEHRAIVSAARRPCALSSAVHPDVSAISCGDHRRFKAARSNEGCRDATESWKPEPTMNTTNTTRHAVLIAALAALTLGAAPLAARAQALVVNQAITEAEVLSAQKAWCQALVDISTTHVRDGQPAAKALAEKVIDAAYGYQMGAVLFKPTLTVNPQTFRTTRAGALAYFVGGDTAFPKDTGFALKGWTRCEPVNAAVFIAGDSATTMGKVHITGKDGKVTTVDKTWKFVKDDAGRLRIVVHHSSLEYVAAN